MPTYYSDNMHTNTALEYMAPQSYNSFGGGPQYFEDYSMSHATSGHSFHNMNMDPYAQYKALNTATAAPPAFGLPPQSFHPGAVPLMPPHRVDQRYLGSQQMSFQQQFPQQPRRTTESQEPQPQKEEKLTGGVSAKLDYSMDQMTDFVAEMSIGMYALFNSPSICIADIDISKSISPGAPVTVNYKKWVFSVLSATRLPSATILQSLSYLSLRMRKLKGPRGTPPAEQSVRKMLTISMILGSKFLDDNTFQNKSWSDVSLIPTADLNREEREWLGSFDHRLHRDVREADGFLDWQNQWKVWLQRSAAAASAALRPIDTNIVRPCRSMNVLSSATFSQQYPRAPASNWSLEPRYNGHQYATPQYSAFDAWHGVPPAYERSPYDRSPSTASHTGPNTPEYGRQGCWAPSNMDPWNNVPYNYDTNYSPFRSNMTNQWADYTPSTSQFGTPTHNIWNYHDTMCYCQQCRQAQQYLAPRYGQVAVG